MLRVVVAERAEDLLDELVEMLTLPLPPEVAHHVFDPEWVGVANVGMRHWVTRGLAARLGAAAGRSDGVAANLTTPLQGALRWRVLAAWRARSERNDAESQDPWDVPRLTWTLLELMTEGGEGVHERLTTVPEGATLAARAQSIAELFDRYAVYRPGMVRAWLDGRAVGGDGQDLAEGARWQFDLYRAVRDRIGARHGLAQSPADRLADALDWVREDPGAMRERGATYLPPRLAMVGPSTLNSETGPLLEALGAHRDVRLLIVSPSVAASVEVAASVAAIGAELPDRSVSWSFPRPPSEPLGHRLLDTWALRPLDSARMLGAGRVPFETVAVESVRSGTLLQRLQSDVRSGEVAPEPFELRPGDRSVRVHAAPGRTRQVEVLRDALLALLRDDPTLEESDIAVVCPALDEFAPVLTAALGPSASRGEQPAEGEVPRLRYSVVDRSARSFNPVLDAAARVLSMLSGRFDVSSVRDVLGLPAVRERFGLTSEDLGMFAELVERAGVRWGLDGPQRARWQVPATHEANSWAAALDQLLAGVAVGTDLRAVATSSSVEPVPAGEDLRLALGGVAPMMVDDGQLDGAGRLAAALYGLRAAHDVLVLGGPRPVAEWCRDVLAAADSLVEPARFEDWQRLALVAAVEALEVASRDRSGVPSPVPFGFAEFRRLLAPSLTGTTTSADLGYGAVVVARPEVVANVPFRVVCVLGLDEDAFPVGRSGGDDLLAAHGAVGDRDRRAEVRADLLAAVMSAREHLLITCSSRSVRTNAPVPRAVVLDELLEVVAATTGVPVDDPTGPGIVKEHPRQSFAGSNFLPGPDGHPVGFDPVAMAGAEALRAGRADTGGSGDDSVLVPVLLDPDPGRSSEVSLDDLVEFYRHPVRHFLRNRLNVAVPRRGESSADGLPLEIDHRLRSELGEVMVRAGLGAPAGRSGPVRELPGVAERLVLDGARGVLPPSPLLDDELDALEAEVEGLLGLVENDLRGPGGEPLPMDETHQLDVVLHLPDEVPGEMAEVPVTGRVSGCVGGDRPGPVLITVSRQKPSRSLKVVLEVAALTLTDPQCHWRGTYLCRGGSNEPPVVEFWELKGDVAARRAGAEAVLGALVTQFWRGGRAALPLFEKTSAAFADGGEKVAAKKWTSRTEWGGEADEPEHVAAFGRRTFEEMRRIEVQYGPGEDSEVSTFESEAAMLWGVVREHFHGPGAPPATPPVEEVAP